MKIVRPKISLSRLKWYCNSPYKDIFDILGGEVYSFKTEEYAFKDNGSKILAVAHCDTHFENKNLYEVYDIIDDYAILSPNLDDRLGVYAIMEMLPQMELNVDTLLTTGEESGCSSAQFFEAPKKYNWIVEFDRRGTDAVTYDYDDEGWDETVNEFFDLGIGSFSDISFMEELKVKAFNVGIGYYREHTMNCYCKLSDLTNQMMRFRRFYNANAHKEYNHTPVARTQYGSWCYGVRNTGFLECYRCYSFFPEKDAYIGDHGLMCPCCGSYIMEPVDMYGSYSKEYLDALQEQQENQIPLPF